MHLSDENRPNMTHDAANRPDPNRPAPPRRDPMPPGMDEPDRSAREYGHSSEDRNTRKRESDWPSLEGGEQRDATPGAPGEASHRED
jgi:hypothetical protein